MDPYRDYCSFCERIGVKPMAELMWRMTHGYSHANGAHVQASKPAIKAEALRERIAMTRDAEAAAIVEPLEE